MTSNQGRHGIEIRIDSTQNDGSQSWVVISRGMNKYLTEMPEGNDDVGTNATNSTPAQHQASSSSMKATIPFEQDIGSLFLSQAVATGMMTAMFVGYRRPYAESYVTKTNFEKLTEQSHGTNCALSTIAWNPQWTAVIGARMIGSSVWHEAVTNNGFNIAWILPETFCIYVPFKVILEDKKLILHCRIT